jgi:pimeloyl-ACP methyl ester carboxylesterase
MSQPTGELPLKDFGLHCIQKPRSDMSIVFVHGILSGGEAAWGQPSWPELLAKESGCQNAGVFVFTYESTLSSGTYSIGDVVDALREHFNLEGLWEQRRVIFVCHSMGGIVVRRFIVANQVKFIERHYPVGLFLVAYQQGDFSGAGILYI